MVSTFKSFLSWLRGSRQRMANRIRCPFEFLAMYESKTLKIWRKVTCVLFSRRETFERKFSFPQMLNCIMPKLHFLHLSSPWKNLFWFTWPVKRQQHCIHAFLEILRILTNHSVFWTTASFVCELPDRIFASSKTVFGQEKTHVLYHVCFASVDSLFCRA